MATITDTKRPTGRPPRPGGPKAAGTGKAAEEEPKSGGKKMLIIILLAVLLGAGVAGGAYFMFIKEPGPPPPPAPGEYVQLEHQTLTLADRHYLKVQIAVQLIAGKGTAETFQTAPAAQLLIDTFSNLSVNELTSTAAREELRGELLKGLQTEYPDQVYDVLLTQFVIQ